jgi:phosphoribosylformimino-5-aminoimidazole carboxamide ribotide isomerase
MRIYFVMDIMDGLVVRGAGGNRKSYKPIHRESEVLSSMNITNSEPLTVFEAIKPRYLYIADLDRIMGTGDNLNTIRNLGKRVEVIADMGFKSREEIKEIGNPVVGTETFDIRLLEGVDTEGVTVSIDILDDLLDASGSFNSWEEMLRFLNSFRLRAVILLTLRRVGTETSPEWRLIEKAIDISDNPVFTGGGVRGMDDVERAKEIGCEGLLVATAVHRKKIPLEIVRIGDY